LFTLRAEIQQPVDIAVFLGYWHCVTGLCHSANSTLGFFLFSVVQSKGWNSAASGQGCVPWPLALHLWD
jgi:hypothetical protein